MNLLGLRQTLIFINCFVAIRERRSVLKSLIIFTSVEKTVKKGSFFHSSHSNKRMYILSTKWKAELTQSWALWSVFELIFWRGAPPLRRCQWEIMWQTISAISQLQQTREAEHRASVNALDEVEIDWHLLLSLTTQFVHKRGSFHNPQFSTENKDKLP